MWFPFFFFFFFFFEEEEEGGEEEEKEKKKRRRRKGEEKKKKKRGREEKEEEKRKRRRRRRRKKKKATFPKLRILTAERQNFWFVFGSSLVQITAFEPCVLFEIFCTTVQPVTACPKSVHSWLPRYHVTFIIH